MKNLAVISISTGIFLSLSSCMVFPDDSNAPPEPGQTVMQGASPKKTVIYRENTRYVPQPAQKTVVYEQNNTRYVPTQTDQVIYQQDNTNTSVPEPGQTEFKSQSDNILEPGQTEFKNQGDNSVPEPGQTEMKSQNDDD